MRLLVVDDDHDLVELLTFALTRAGFEVCAAHDSPTALRLIEEQEPALAVLDVSLGAWDGFELLQEVRRRSAIPVIMLTGHTAEEEKVRALDLGADDYITKPFSHRELVARIRANLRRVDAGAPAAPTHETELRVGPVTLNVAEHGATLDGAPLSLTVTEFRLLHYLMANAGRVATTGAVLRHVWGYDDPSGSDLVRVTTYRLRRKLGDDAASPRLLHTVPGVGLLLKAAEDEPDFAR
jgi:two-component system, OmpR family, response regulator VicR